MLSKQDQSKQTNSAFLYYLQPLCTFSPMVQFRIVDMTKNLMVLKDNVSLCPLIKYDIQVIQIILWTSLIGY